MSTVADIEYALSGFIIVVGVAYTIFIAAMTRKDEREQEQDH